MRMTKLLLLLHRYKRSVTLFDNYLLQYKCVFIEWFWKSGLDLNLSHVYKKFNIAPLPGVATGYV